MASQGKTILITGSTDGVGRHVALELATAGATVLIHGRSRERAESLLGEIRKRGNNAAAFYPGGSVVPGGGARARRHDPQASTSGSTS